MRLTKWVIFTFLATLLVGCSNLNDVSPEEAAELFKAHKAIIVDVREPEEWNEQHIQGAIFMPLGDVKNRLHELAAYKTSTVIMQCRSGKRSAKAAQILMDAGFKDIYNMQGGILAWSKAKLATVKGASQ